MVKQEEKDKVIASIERSFSNIIATTRSFDDNSFNKVPFEGSWTAGQVLDHITKSSIGTPDGHVKDADRPYDQLAVTAENIFLDFSTKLNSPEQLKAGPGPFTKAEMIERLEKNRALLIDTARNRDLTQFCLDFELPRLGFLTRYEWLRFIDAHVLRHDHQLKKIKEVLNK